MTLDDFQPDAKPGQKITPQTTKNDILGILWAEHLSKNAKKIRHWKETFDFWGAPFTPGVNLDPPCGWGRGVPAGPLPPVQVGLILGVFKQKPQWVGLGQRNISHSFRGITK